MSFMKRLSAKELTIILIEFLIAILISFLFSKINFFDNNKILYSIITLIFLGLIFIIILVLILWIIYRRIGEIDEALDEQEKGQKKLEEKLKIHEMLINIESRLIALEGKYGKKN